jgi:hypothetical protein
MPISGGRDSRHLLLELLDAGCPPERAVTAHHHANVWGGDVPYAADLCRAFGVAHEIVSPGRLVADEWRKNRLTSYCADEHAWYLAVADALERTHPRHLRRPGRRHVHALRLHAEDASPGRRRVEHPLGAHR